MMNVATLQIWSDALDRPANYIALLPDSSKVPGPYAVLYQLHGRMDNGASWLYKTNLVRYVGNLPLIVILPNGENSSWANIGPREKYEDYLMKDLAEHIRQTYQIREGKWAIGGLSMGGGGAIRLGLKYPERFCSIWAHSSAVFTKEQRRRSFERRGEPVPANLDDLDVYALVDKLDPETMPKLSFDCGTEDSLIENNREFHRYLDEKGIPHTYKEHPGAHTWDYWDTYVQEALRQHAQVLGLEPGGVTPSTKVAAS